MKHTALYLFVLAAVAFGIGLSAVFLGWPPVGFEAASGVFAYGVILGSIFTLSAIISLILGRFQNR